MSEIYRDSVGLGLIVSDDIGGDGGVDRAVKALAGIKHGAEKAIASALKRATSSGAMLAQKEIRKTYVLSASTFKEYTKDRRHYTTNAGGTTVSIEFAGFHIPLMKFSARVSGDGSVRARVKRSSAQKTIDGAFSQTVGEYGHAGIFERVGEDRFPIRELYGPSVPQMLDYNEDLSQEVGDQIREKFEQRIDHEITAMLNGWRT